MQHQEAVETFASERYLLGEMNDAERDSFEEHYFSCAECADDVRTGAVMRDGVRMGLAKTGQTRRTWRPAIVIPWAAAASMALLAGYQTMTERPSGALSAALPLAPMTLRASTRGQEAVVSRGPGGAVTLALDLGGRRFESGLRYQLKRADGSIAADGHSAAPSPGAPFLLVLPSNLISSAGRYSIVLQDSSNTGLTPEEYRFSVDAR